jgi:hypothetical protein
VGGAGRIQAPVAAHARTSKGEEEVGKRTRRTFTDAVKINTVRRIDAGSSAVKEAARLQLVATVIRRWLVDPRYQSPGDALPTKAVAEKRRRASAGKPKRTNAKPIVITSQECPHCGGQLEVKAA